MNYGDNRDFLALLFYVLKDAKSSACWEGAVVKQKMSTAQ